MELNIRPSTHVSLNRLRCLLRSFAKLTPRTTTTCLTRTLYAMTRCWRTMRYRTFNDARILNSIDVSAFRTLVKRNRACPPCIVPSTSSPNTQVVTVCAHRVLTFAKCSHCDTTARSASAAKRRLANFLRLLRLTPATCACQLWFKSTPPQTLRLVMPEDVSETQARMFACPEADA